MARAAVDPVQALLASAAKKYDLTVGSMNNVVEGIQFMTTGNIAIDYAMGGGVPYGRSVELFGPPSCGKTTTAIQTAVNLQKVIIAGGDKKLGVSAKDVILYLDYEHAMDKDYAKALGLDVNHPSFLFAQPDTLEDGANFTLDLLKTGRCRLVIFDAVAGMNPSVKQEADIGKSLPAVQAKLMKEFGVTLNGVLANNNASAIFLNHLIDKFDMGGSPRPGMPKPTTTPGGIAMKYFASVRVQYNQMQSQKGTVIDPLSNELVERNVSTNVMVKVIKNKVAPPFRQAVVRVRYGKGFDNFWTALQVLIANKKIIYASPYFKFHNLVEFDLIPSWMPHLKEGTKPPAVNGEKRLFKAADADPVWREKIIELAKKVVFENIEILSKVAPQGEPVDEEDEDEEDDDIEQVGAKTAGGRVKI
jgi:protein RecA